jgi:hypothetical protein
MCTFRKTLVHLALALQYVQDKRDSVTNEKCPCSSFALKKDKEKKTWVENIRPLRLLCIESCNLDGKIIT